MARFKKKNGEYTWLIVLGIIALVFLVGRTTFFGALVTTCENIEPKMIIEYTDALAEINGTVTPAGFFAVKEETGMTNHNKYLAESTLGSFELVEPTNMSCSQLLAKVDFAENNTQYIVLNQRQVLMTEEGFMWCNYNNNIALRADSLATLSNYYSHFEICTTEEKTLPVEGDLITDEQECLQLRGNWVNEECRCSDDSLLEVGHICPDTEQSSTPSGTISAPVSPPVEQRYEPTITQPVQETKTVTPTVALSALGGLIILFLLYWFFEKGPNKGLIRNRRKRR